ncbi:MAG: N-acetyltransferase [Sphingobacteriaceae bacterium]|nr:N-acetyltransferase [Sphingobacteriaceae bacterium]
MKYEETPLIYNENDHRFEFTVDNHLSLIDFKRKGDTIYLVHTEVPEELEGKGVAAAMVEKTFQYIEEHNLKLAPYCSYVQLYLKRHPEWNRLL